jgi:hypothetical protein
MLIIILFCAIVKAQSCIPYYLECYNNYTFPVLNNSTLYCNTFYMDYAICISQCGYSNPIREWLISYCKETCELSFCEYKTPPSPFIPPSPQQNTEHSPIFDVILFICLLILSGICGLLSCIVYVYPCCKSVYEKCVK